jgi:hypothetical protein
VYQASGVPSSCSHRFRHTLATEILEMGGSIQEAADVLGDSEAIVRKHYAKWSARRQGRISDLPKRLWHVYDARDSSEKEIQKNDLWPYAAHAIQRATTSKE